MCVALCRPSQKLTKAESDDSFNEASSSAAASEFIRKADSPSKQLVSDLLEENGKLIDERNQLATRCGLFYRSFFRLPCL